MAAMVWKIIQAKEIAGFYRSRQCRYIGVGAAGILKSVWPVYRSSSDIKSRSASKTAFCREHRQCSTDGELQCKIPALLTDIKDRCADCGVTLNGSKDHNESQYYFKSKRKQIFP